MSDARKYSDDEVRAIIDRALKGGASGVGHADLLSIGEQVGIPAEAMARAAAEERQARLEGEALTSIGARRRRWLGLHAAAFALLNGLLFGVNALTTPGEWWVLFPVIFWGLALALHGAVTFAAGASAGALERERRRLGSASSGQRVRIGATSAQPAVAESASDEAAQSAVASGQKTTS